MTRPAFVVAALAVVAHTALMLALLTYATDGRWVPVQIAATVATIATLWRCARASV